MFNFTAMAVILVLFQVSIMGVSCFDVENLLNCLLIRNEMVTL